MGKRTQVSVYSVEITPVMEISTHFPPLDAPSLRGARGKSTDGLTGIEGQRQPDFEIDGDRNSRPVMIQRTFGRMLGQMAVREVGGNVPNMFYIMWHQIQLLYARGPDPLHPRG